MAPSSLNANATSTTQVYLSWTPPQGATNGYTYRIERSINYDATPDHGFEVINTVPSSSYTDTIPTTTAAKTYLYRVRSVLDGQYSPWSTLSFATTKSFAEQISNQGPARTSVSATHFLELKEAVDAVRAAAGLPAFNWSDSQGRAPAYGVRFLNHTCRICVTGWMKRYRN